MRRLAQPTYLARQRGAATLIVVMVLFFVISLTAAYTNRNLIFEQRTSLNQYRSTQALEAADAGLEWAVSMLNFGRINDACTKSSSVTDTSFRQRYLTIDASSGKITPKTMSSGAALTPSCVRSASGWTCSCPSNSDPTLAAPTAPGTYPAFRVRFRPVIGSSGSLTVPRQPLVVIVEVVACTQLDTGSNQCLTFNGQGVLNEGRVLASTIVGLKGNAAGPPQAAITARGSVNLGGAALAAYNTLPTGNGLTVHAGGAVNTTNLVLRSSPGSPSAESVVENDSALNYTGAVVASVTPFSAADRMFAAVYNMRPEAYQAQQAIEVLTCPTGGCTAAAVRTAVSLNPWRPLWLTGDLVIDSAGDIGSAAEPVSLVVNGNIVHTVGGVTVYGLAYSRSATLTTSGAGQFVGALVAEGDLGGSGTSTVVYDDAVLRLLRFNSGSFARVPGTWKDYQ